MNRLLLSGLQLFNEAVQGKKIVYLYRVRSEQAKNDATALAFTTENGRTKSKDADTTIEYLKSEYPSYTAMKAKLHERVQFKEAAAASQSVLEMASNKAKDDFYNWLLEAL